TAVRGRKVAETAAEATVVAVAEEAAAVRKTSVTDDAGAFCHGRMKKSRSGERLLDWASGRSYGPQPDRLRVASSRSGYPCQSSSSDRSRTAPLSADMTSFA
ncbi:hypothetical protein, partial [Burkholderia sp. Ac-20392]|uniref:hypothetical protein n=1 Tax=Burkholderia sp. Ac-20392 TaxID=2703905 RepID=UPI00197F5866